MSGRVRWRPFCDEPRAPRMLCVGPLRVGDVCPVGGEWRATLYGTDEARTFSRRRPAVCWLLARAAGLAEVPRGRAWERRHGWRRIDPTGLFDVYERARRRRG